jgi:multidrug efflux system membrane fusion protein
MTRTLGKKWATAGITAALVAGGAFVWVSRLSDNDNEAQAKGNLPADTAQVTKQTLVDKETHDGSLTYADTSTIRTKLSGTLTGLATAGSTVERGGAICKIDNEPVVVLYGSLPGYRTLSPGTEGSDVTQFETNLWALGYRGFTVDDEYTSATAHAVQKWQEDLGLDKTGTVEPGRVVYTTGAVRVDSRSAELDDTVQPGTEILQVSGLGRVATVELTIDDQRLAKPGAAVDVTLPDATMVKGTISNVETKVEKAKDQNSHDTTKIDVTISFGEAPTGLDEAAVSVDFVVSERADVLTVPVDALLALAEGGYGLQVVDGSTTRIVAVQAGLFADGRVEVSGGGITQGIKVGVPG